MKKVILFALILAVCGGFHNLALAQVEDPNLYLVTFIKSQTNNVGIQAATVITVVNQSSRSCNVQVQWFRSNATGPVCTLPLTVTPVAPGSAVQFCSRDLPNSITNCGGNQTICSPGTVNALQGRAIVSSSSEVECRNIAVDARVYYTTPGDAAVSAISNSKVVFFGEGNLGD